VSALPPKCLETLRFLASLSALAPFRCFWYSSNSNTHGSGSLDVEGMSRSVSWLLTRNSARQLSENARFAVADSFQAPALALQSQQKILLIGIFAGYIVFYGQQTSERARPVSTLFGSLSASWKLLLHLTSRRRRLTVEPSSRQRISRPLFSIFSSASSCLFR
jgi:hypothetical protein